MADAGLAGAHLVDTHCHLDARQFAGEPLATVLERAAAAGVTRVVTIGTDLRSSQTAVALAEAHPAVRATVGVDPNDLVGFSDTTLAELAELGDRSAVVAIGEIGLDYRWLRSPPDAQQPAFRAQLDLARRLELPVVIHSRSADEDTAAILLEWAHGGRQNGRPLGVMHCFAGDLALGERLVDAGFLISLSGVVTYRNAVRTHQVAAGLPDEAIVLETDAPYLAPDPYRGQRNEPARVRLIAERVAELRGASLSDLARHTSANAARLFGWEVEGA